MNEQPTRRDMLRAAARGAGLIVIGGVTVPLVARAGAHYDWQIDPSKCLDIRLGTVGVEACQRCATNCVLPLSAVRAVNDFSKCGRCCVCPAYYDVKSDVGPDGLPSRRLCPRDAIKRTAIGEVDEYDPLNNFYEYTIDEKKCNGCGLCVMACKEPAGLGSIRLEVRYDLCVTCNRCSIAQVCPENAIDRTDGRHRT